MKLTNRTIAAAQFYLSSTPLDRLLIMAWRSSSHASSWLTGHQRFSIIKGYNLLIMSREIPERKGQSSQKDWRIISTNMLCFKSNNVYETWQIYFCLFLQQSNCLVSTNSENPTSVSVWQQFNPLPSDRSFQCSWRWWHTCWRCSRPLQILNLHECNQRVRSYAHLSGGLNGEDRRHRGRSGLKPFLGPHLRRVGGVQIGTTPYGLQLDY